MWLAIELTVHVCAISFTLGFCHWCRVNGSTSREPLPCTHPSTPSTRLYHPQVPFFKSSV